MSELRKQLIRALERASVKYAHLIVDLNGSVACSKVSSVEYSANTTAIYDLETDPEKRKELLTKYWEDNIKLIAYSPEYFKGEKDGLIELSETYHDFFLNKLSLFINGDFTTQGLITVLYTLDYIHENIEKL